jgi:hypothetical protein
MIVTCIKCDKTVYAKTSAKKFCTSCAKESNAETSISWKQKKMADPSYRKAEQERQRGYHKARMEDPAFRERHRKQSREYAAAKRAAEKAK